MAAMSRCVHYETRRCAVPEPHSGTKCARSTNTTKPRQHKPNRRQQAMRCARGRTSSRRSSGRPRRRRRPTFTPWTAGGWRGCITHTRRWRRTWRARPAPWAAAGRGPLGSWRGSSSSSSSHAVRRSSGRQAAAAQPAALAQQQLQQRQRWRGSGPQRLKRRRVSAHRLGAAGRGLPASGAAACWWQQGAATAAAVRAAARAAEAALVRRRQRSSSSSSSSSRQRSSRRFRRRGGWSKLRWTARRGRPRHGPGGCDCRAGI